MTRIYVVDDSGYHLPFTVIVSMISGTVHQQATFRAAGEIPRSPIDADGGLTAEGARARPSWRATRSGVGRPCRWEEAIPRDLDAVDGEAEGLVERAQFPDRSLDDRLELGLVFGAISTSMERRSPGGASG